MTSCDAEQARRRRSALLQPEFKFTAVALKVVKKAAKPSGEKESQSMDQAQSLRVTARVAVKPEIATFSALTGVQIAPMPTLAPSEQIYLQGFLTGLNVSVDLGCVGLPVLQETAPFAVETPSSARRNVGVLVMAAGSVVGAFVGGLLLGIVPNSVLLPALSVILLLSAVKVWRHSRHSFTFRASTVASCIGWNW